MIKWSHRLFLTYTYTHSHTKLVFAYASFLSFSSHCVFNYVYIIFTGFLLKSTETCVSVCLWLCLCVGDVNGSEFLIVTIDVDVCFGTQFVIQIHRTIVWIKDRGALRTVYKSNAMTAQLTQLKARENNNNNFASMWHLMLCNGKRTHTERGRERKRDTY